METVKKKKATGHFKNIDPYPDGVASKWNNATKELSGPEWYGPYLDERACYYTPRSKENVTAGSAAARAMGLYT